MSGGDPGISMLHDNKVAAAAEPIIDTDKNNEGSVSHNNSMCDSNNSSSIVAKAMGVTCTNNGCDYSDFMTFRKVSMLQQIYEFVYELIAIIFAGE